MRKFFILGLITGLLYLWLPILTNAYPVVTGPNANYYISEDAGDVADVAVFDSAKVYKIKYLTGAKTNTFKGFDYDEEPMYLDSVYVNIPDGQFVVNRSNRHSLRSRTMSRWDTDTIYYCFTPSGDLMPDVYLCDGDTVEIYPVTDAELNIINPYLGYKYISPSDQNGYYYYFSCSSPDSLAGRILGADTEVMLLAKGDTAAFLLDAVETIAGAPAIGGIVALQKQVFRLRSATDSTLYLAESTPIEMTMTDIAYTAGLFYIKESQYPGQYYLARARNSNKVLVIAWDSKRLIQVNKNTADFTLFRIGQQERPPGSEPDPYTYLNRFPELKGKGYYEFRIVDPYTKTEKNLTKDFYDYAALGLEGESMLRAGSYAPYDLQLWTDTAIGYGTNKNKPSFYIVKDVDTTSAGLNNLYIEGYFLHVMDSTALDSHNDYTVNLNGKEYNRMNFVKAFRTSSSQLMVVATGQTINTTQTINEYRFYFQETDEASKYYLVTEAGLGDDGISNVRAYLSIKNDTIYAGPREGALKVHIRGGTVSNEFVPTLPAVPEQEITVAGGKGRIDIFNAAGQQVSIYDLTGRQVLQQSLTANHETIPVAAGILIVKAGTVTRKVIVK